MEARIVSGPPFSLVRTGLIARITLIEALRQRIAWLVLPAAGGLVLCARVFGEFNFGLSELKFIADFGFGGMVLAGSLLTIAATSQLFHGEMENRTALTLLAKPVGRAEFLLGKLLGVLALVALFSAAMTALITFLLWSRESSLLHTRPELFGPAHGLRYADVIAVGFVHGMGFAVLAALTLAVASYARTGLFTVMMSLGALVVCHLQHVAQEVYERAGTPILRGAMGGIALIFPDFQVFDLGDLLESDGGIEAALLVRVSAYALSYIVMLGALAVFLFRRREI